MSIYLLILLIIVVSAGNIFGQSNTKLTPTMILQEYEKTLSSFPQKWAIKAKGEFLLEGYFGSPRPEKYWEEYHYYRDANRLDIGFNRGEYDHQGNQGNPELRRRSIVTNTGIFYGLRHQNSSANAIYTQDGKNLESQTFAQLSLGEALDGRLAHDEKSLMDLLRESSDLRLHDNPENVDGHNCYILEGKTSHGRYKIWFDPESGYLPRKAIVNKGLHDIYEEGRISDLPSFSVGKLTECSFTMDSVVIEKIGDIFFPKKCKMVEVRTFHNGHTISVHNTHERTKVDFDPDFVALGAFEPELPDGTPVYHKDFPGVRFQWFGGRLVPQVVDEVLEEIHKTIDPLRNEGSSKSMSAKNESASLPEVKDPPVEADATRDVEKEISVGIEKAIEQSDSKPMSFIYRGLTFVVVICLVLGGIRCLFYMKKRNPNV